MDENNSNNNLEEQEVNPELNEENKEVINNTEINNVTNNTVKEITKKQEKVKYVEKKDKNKRKGDREIVVEYRKPSIFTSILLILIGALIATIILLSIYIVKENKKVEVYDEPQNNVEEIENNQKDNEKEKVKLDLSIDGEFVKGIYAKIPLQVRGYEPYNGNKVLANDISDNNKLLFAIRTLQSEYKYEVITDKDSVKAKLHNKAQYIPEYTEIIKFDFNETKARYKSIFGTDKEIPLIDAETTLGYVYEYIPQDNCYYGHSYAGGGGGDYQDSRKIYKVEQNEDGTEVYIYDYYISFNGTINNKYGLFSTSENSSEKDMITIIGNREWASNGSVVLEGKTLSELLEEYIGNGAGEYKHTYKLDSAGNYYWHSSEKIN